MDAVRADSRVVWAMLNSATMLGVEGTTVQVGLANDNLVRTAMGRDAHLALAAAIAKVCGCATSVAFSVGGGSLEPSTSPDDVADQGGARIDDADAGAPPNSIDLIASMLGGTVLEEFEQGDG